MKNKGIEEYIHARNVQTRANYFDNDLKANVHFFTQQLLQSNYIKNFTWMGVPILQYPMDLQIMQELICEIKPNVIIETGVAFGGSLLFYACMLDLVIRGGIVYGIEIDMKQENEDTLMSAIFRRNPSMLKLIKGSSIDPEIVKNLSDTISRDFDNPTVMVVLDSNHSHAHVLKEIELYSPLVTVGSYLVVMDTAIEDYMTGRDEERGWGPGDNPKTAVNEFLYGPMQGHKHFRQDFAIETRALITASPGGWLEKIA
jgi:cephalosporin hydroxylase